MYKTCATCVRIRDWYCSSGFFCGELASQIYECLEFDYRTVPDDNDEDDDDRSCLLTPFRP